MRQLLSLLPVVILASCAATSNTVLDTPPSMPGEASYRACVNARITDAKAGSLAGHRSTAASLVQQCRQQLQAWEADLVAANPNVAGRERQAKAYVDSYEMTLVDRTAAEGL